MSAELLMQCDGSAFVYIECPSSLLPQLLAIVHEFYINEIDQYGINAFDWISMAAFLTPKYWDSTSRHCID